MEKKCLRCGKCCYMRQGEFSKKCKYLIKLASGRTLCRVYRTRIGREIGNIGDTYFHCTTRDNSPYDYEGCPFNTTKEVVK